MITVAARMLLQVRLMGIMRRIVYTRVRYDFGCNYLILVMLCLYLRCDLFRHVFLFLVVVKNG